MNLLEATNLAFAYPGGHHVFDNINLRVRPAEAVAIVGRSGCGKSTLLRVLCGLERPTTGRMTMRDREVKAGDVPLMTQHDGLFEWQSVAKNLTLAARIEGTTPPSEKQVQQLLREVGLPNDIARSWPAQLSGGMRSRVAFLRILASSAPLIALDEPFGALDALTRAEVNRWLRKVAIRRQLAIIMVTHDLTEAVTTADRVICWTHNGTTEHDTAAITEPTQLEATKIVAQLENQLRHQA